MTASRLNISPVPANQLTAEQLSQWSDLQRADPGLASPFIRPEFTLAAANVFQHVEVAILEQNGREVGFFPFQRGRGKLAVPVGGLMSHFQGVVLSPGLSFSPEALLKACGLVSWSFNHLQADQAAFRRFHTVRGGAPYLDLSHGCDAYLEERRAAGKKDFFRTIFRLTRRLERELGPLRMEFPATDRGVLDTLIAWKSAQYQRNKTLNFITLPGTRELMETLFATRTPHFEGMISALYAGDRLVSADFGLRSGKVLHSWITTYDSTLAARHSPGHSLTLKMAQTAPSLGIERIDLGKGPEPHKLVWMSAAIELAEGAVDMRPLPRMLKATWIRTRDWIRSSPLQESARRCKRVVRPLYERVVYRSARAAALQRRG